MILQACLLISLIAPQTTQSRARVELRVHAHDDGGQGRLRWFDGSWDELLASAKETDRLVLLDFWADWCHFCKRLQKETYSDARVAEEMSDVLCFSVDIDAEKNAALVRRFKANGKVPMLVFLEPDAELRDLISGFLPPKDFLVEVQRIKRNEDTLSGLRATIDKHPKDFDARYQLAVKLRHIGDQRGYEREIAAIQRLDPEGRSVPSRQLKLEKLRKHAEAGLRPETLYAFLEQETDPNLLFEGWYAVWQLEDYLAKQAESEPECMQHRQRNFAAARSLWPYVPKKYWSKIGNNIAWSYWECRKFLAAADMEWALEVVQAVVKEAPDVPHAIDTLACCLWAVGRKDEAIAAVRRCIELEPLNGMWKQRLAELTGP